MPPYERRRRYGMFVAGAVTASCGIAFITRAALGTSPISSLPFVLSLITPPSLGVYTFCFNLVFLAAEALLRRSFTAQQALQIPFTVLFSACIDAFMWLIPTQLHGPLLWKVVYLLVGCAILGLGVTLEVFGGVTMLPGEALVRAISRRSGMAFHKVKILFDSSLAIAAAMVALPAFGRLNGVKEGTVIAALLVGQLVHLYSKYLGPGLERMLTPPVSAGS
jgi:uncharacterized membrane protein YczE